MSASAPSSATRFSVSANLTKSRRLLALRLFVFGRVLGIEGLFERGQGDLGAYSLASRVTASLGLAYAEAQLGLLSGVLPVLEGYFRAGEVAL